MREIFCHIEQCLGCKSCELACAVFHSKSGDLHSAIREYPTPLSRVHVIPLDEEHDFGTTMTIPLQCRHCAEPACVDACIAGGVVKDEVTGIVSFNAEKCVGCWSCTMVCQFGAVIRSTGLAKAVKCDRCENIEIPSCVKACPTKALVFCEKEEFLALLKQAEETE